MKYLRISLIALATIFISYWLVQIALTIWDKSSKSAVWSLIPADAVAVWQIPNATQTYKQLDSTAIWKSLKTSPQFNLLAEKAKFIDILSGEGIAIDNYFNDKAITVSLHTTTKDNFDFMFFVPILIKDNTVFRNALQNIITRNHARVETRNYQGIEIQEVKFPEQKQLFSYTIYKGYFVGSFTALLLEETIRNISELGRNNFYSANKTAFSLKKPQEHEAFFYFNADKMPKFLQVFYKDSFKTALQDLANLQTNGYYTTEIDNKKLIFKGLQNIPQSSELGLFVGMKPTACDLLPQFLPKKTASLYRISFDNTNEFFNRLAIKSVENNENQKNNENQRFNEHWQDSLINSDVLDFQEFINYFEGEIAVATLENTINLSASKLLYIKVKEPLELNKKLQEYAQELAKKAKDTLLYENFANQRIVKLNYKEFPKSLFGGNSGGNNNFSFSDNFSGFQNSYFTFINGYLLIGNTPKAIATVLEDVENEQVWAKIFHASPLLTQLEQPSNVCYVKNILRTWDFATQQLNPTWQDYVEQNKRQFLRFEFLTLQYVIDEDANIANSQITLFHKSFDDKIVAKNIRTMYETNFYNSLITSTFVVKNIADKSKEVLVQDAGNHLHLLAVNGKKLWHFPVESPIAKQVYQIDLQANTNKNQQENQQVSRQLHYLFAAQNKVFLLNKNGQLITGFPIILKDCGNIEFLSLLDYDNSKNYRIAVADNEGNVFLLSKFGKTLQGFNPKRLAGKLASPIVHTRIDSKDVLVGLNKQGIVNLLKRNGEMYAGFPVSVGTNLSANFFVQQNPDFQLTTIHVLTIEGEIIKLNLSGKVIGRESLERPNTQSIFKLLPDISTASDYIFSRQDDTFLTIFNKNLTPLFTKNFSKDLIENAATKEDKIANKVIKNNQITSEKLVQYFNFGANTEIIAVTDTETQKVYLHYLNGDLLCEPLESEQEISLFFNEIKNEYLIYTVFGNRVSAKRITKI